MATLYEAVVYEVLSADRFLLAIVAGGKASFKDCFLQNVQAPRPTRRAIDGSTIDDEPLAFEALDFVRTVMIGKKVSVIDEQENVQNGRWAIKVNVPNGNAMSDMATLLLQKGYAVPNNKPNSAQDRPLWEKYQEITKLAKTKRVGVHVQNIQHQVRKVRPFPPPHSEPSFAMGLHKKVFKLRVEKVQSGHNFLVEVPVDQDPNTKTPLRVQRLWVNMTGIRATQCIPGEDDKIPDIATKAKLHCERLILNRKVSVRFDGVDSAGQVIGSLVSPSGGLFQESLLKDGLAVCLHPSAIQIPEKEKLLEISNAAKEKLVGMWKFEKIIEPKQENGENGENAENGAAEQAPEAAPAANDEVTDNSIAAVTKQPAGHSEYKGDQEFEGELVQIIAGDLLVVRKSPTEYVKVSLVGIKAPRDIDRDGVSGMSGGPRAPESRASYTNFTWECKEYLRQYIGKRCQVHIEYARTIQESLEERPVGSIRVLGENGGDIGTNLLKEGLADYFLPKGSLCSNSMILQEVCNGAKEQKKCIHGDRPSAVTKVTELNQIGESKGKYYLTFFHRGMAGKMPPRWKATVDMAMSGSSFRVYIPREHCQISLKLAGIVSPSTGFGNEPADPFGPEAKDLAITTLCHQDVEVIIETVDKRGNFIGYLYHKGKNFAVTAVEEGLGSVSGADRTLFPSDLSNAEKVAKAAKKGIWSSTGAIPRMQLQREAKMMERRVGAQNFTRSNNTEWNRIMLTDFSDASEFSFIPSDAKTEERQTVIDGLVAEAMKDVKDEKYVATKKGEVVIAKFADDGSWNRGRIVALPRAGEPRVEVEFLDFGNVQFASNKSLRKIPAEPKYGPLHTLAPQAKTGHIAFISGCPDNSQREDCDEAAAELGWEFSQDANVQAYAAKEEYRSDEGVFYTVAKQPSGETLAEAYVAAGYAQADRTMLQVDLEQVKTLMAKQEIAKKRHLGMYQYGDVEQDEDQ